MALCKFNPKLVSQVYFEKSKIESVYRGWKISLPRLYVSLSKERNINSNNEIQQLIQVVNQTKENSDIKGLNFYGKQGLEAVEILYTHKIIDSKMYEEIHSEIKFSLIAAEAAYKKLINQNFYPDKLFSDDFYGDISFTDDLKAKTSYELMVDMKKTTDEAIQKYIEQQRQELNTISNFDSNLFIESLNSGNVSNPDA